MIIGIDGNEANVSARVGVSWYTYHILQELRASPHTIRVFLKEPPLPDMPHKTKTFSYEVVRGKLWSQVSLPAYLFAKPPEVYIAPAHYAPRRCPCPTVIVIHDVSYRYYPHYFTRKDLYQLSNWTRYSVKRAGAVVAVSASTQRDIRAEYGVESTVVYNGYTPTEIKKVTREKNSFLYIGTIQPRKNIEVLLRALLYNDATLTIIGKDGWMSDGIYELVHSLHLSERVTIRSYVSEEEKNEALGVHTALLLPGYYEGFGLPMLEAFNARLPVIASTTGALPEIGGDACVLVNPNDPYAWAKAMEKAGSIKVEKGVKRLRQFSWEKTGKELLSICERVKALQQ